MRLIDADRLSDVINNINYVPVCIDCYTKHEILELIDEQPAVIIDIVEEEGRWNLNKQNN